MINSFSSSISRYFQEVSDISDVILDRDGIWNSSLLRENFFAKPTRHVLILNKDASQGDLRSAFEQARKIYKYVHIEILPKNPKLANSVDLAKNILDLSARAHGKVLTSNAEITPLLPEDEKVRSILLLRQKLKQIENILATSEVKSKHPLIIYAIKLCQCISPKLSDREQDSTQLRAQVLNDLISVHNQVQNTLQITDQQISQIFRKSTQAGTLMTELNPSEQDLKQHHYIPQLRSMMNPTWKLLRNTLITISQPQKDLLYKYNNQMLRHIQNWDDTQVLTNLAKFSQSEQSEEDQLKVLNIARLNYFLSKGEKLLKSPLEDVSLKEVKDMIENIHKAIVSLQDQD